MTDGFTEAAASYDQASPPELTDDRPRHIIIEVDGTDGLGKLARYCRTPGCRVDRDASTDCCQDACPHCGTGGLTFDVSERGDVTRFACHECERWWSR